MTSATKQLDSDIEAAARQRFNCLAANVVVQDVPEYKTIEGPGRWYVLSIRRTAADDWEVVARRRTRGELLASIGTGQVSREAAGARYGARGEADYYSA